MHGDQRFCQLRMRKSRKHARIDERAIHERAQDHNDHDLEQSIDDVLPTALFRKRFAKQRVENRGGVDQEKSPMRKRDAAPIRRRRRRSVSH